MQAKILTYLASYAQQCNIREVMQATSFLINLQPGIPHRTYTWNTKLRPRTFG